MNCRTQKLLMSGLLFTNRLWFCFLQGFLSVVPIFCVWPFGLSILHCVAVGATVTAAAVEATATAESATDDAAAAAEATLQYLHSAGIQTRDSATADSCAPNELQSTLNAIFWLGLVKVASCQSLATGYVKRSSTAHLKETLQQPQLICSIYWDKKINTATKF